jgi:hypothetical protein
MRHGQYDLRIALGRKNFIFVGGEEHGHNLAVLYT